VILETVWRQTVRRCLPNSVPDLDPYPEAEFMNINFIEVSGSVVDPDPELREFSKKFETARMVFSGAWGGPIHEKKPEVENLLTLSL
jgi:hypothetical protein